jgi:hypothetical protein
LANQTLNHLNRDFYNQIATSTAHRPVRDLLSGMVLHDVTLLPTLMNLALDTSDKNHHRACWILELVCEANILLLAPYLDPFCDALPRFTNDSTIRPMSKICWFATEFNQKSSGLLTPEQLEQITEACFDWLIDPDGKVAAKAYSMRSLYVIGKKEEWIYPELQRILSEDSGKHTAAYTAAAKDILKRIKKSR